MSCGISSRITRHIPALGWLRGYRVGWLRGDVVAGITLAAYLMPASIGDASLAGLPPEAGLDACLLSGLVFWLFTSSRNCSRLCENAESTCTLAEAHSGVRDSLCRAGFEKFYGPVFPDQTVDAILTKTTNPTPDTDHHEP